MVKALGCEPRDCEFESRHSPQGENMTEIKKWQPYQLTVNDGSLFPVPPELSGLTYRSDLTKLFNVRKSLEKGAAFTTGGVYLADGNVLIQDCLPGRSEGDNNRLAQTICKLLNRSDSATTFQLLSASDLNYELIYYLASLILGRQTANVLVFPGTGAKSVYNYLGGVRFGQCYNCIFLENPRNVKPEELPDIDPQKRVVIIDDVVASGDTVNQVARALLRKYGIIRDLRVATWLLEDKAKIMNGINQVFASIVVKGNYCSRPPVNSLSCLLSAEGSYETVKTGYTRKYFNGTSPLDSLKQLLDNY